MPEQGREGALLICWPALQYALFAPHAKPCWSRQNALQCSAEKRWHQRSCPQGVRHQGTAPRPHLNQLAVLRLAQFGPHMHAPQAEQFAKNLANIGSRNEITANAKRFTHQIIAMFGIAQTGLHIIMQAQGTVPCRFASAVFWPSRFGAAGACSSSTSFTRKQLSQKLFDARLDPSPVFYCRCSCCFAPALARRIVKGAIDQQAAKQHHRHRINHARRQRSDHQPRTLFELAKIFDNNARQPITGNRRTRSQGLASVKGQIFMGQKAQHQQQNQPFKRRLIKLAWMARHTASFRIRKHHGPGHIRNAPP